MQPELEKYIQKNLDELDRRSPDPAVLGRVLQQMQVKGKPAPRGILIPFRAIWWAAACVAMITGTIMLWPTQQQPAVVAGIEKKEVKKQEIKLPDIIVQETKPPDTTASQLKHPGIDAVNNDLAARTAKIAKDINAGKLIIFADFNKMPSAADRINAVSATAALKESRNEVLNGLLNVLDKDPNTNVRLAALDGLARFYRDDYTRKKLLASLKKQKDPVVQIALIGLLTRMRESGIISELEKMVQDQHTEKTVKDCAYSAILQLGT